ncbi:MAG: hypothetical protein AAF950_04680 [Pseudomonadota bacterium]
MQQGDYAYRFTGHSIDNGYDHYLVGVGTMKLGTGGTIGGYQRTALTRLSGHDSALIIGSWSIDGSFAKHENPYGEHDYSARMTFTEQNPDNLERRQILEGTFSFVPISDKRIWVIATGGRILSSNGEPINEAVSGEAEWIS